jgi:hypothetical protein
MNKNPIDWDDLAYENNFSNDKQMLIHFHHVLKMSQVTIGKKLGIHGSSVGKRMKFLNVNLIPIPPERSVVSSPRLPKKGV